LFSHTPNQVLKGLIEVHKLAIIPNSCKERTEKRRFFLLQRIPEEIITESVDSQLDIRHPHISIEMLAILGKK
jgi:hypothetical protein